LAARVFARFGIRDAMVVSSLASTGRYVDELGGARESAVCELRSGEVGPAVTYGPGDLPGLWVGRGALDGAPETVEDAVKMVVDVIAGRGPEPYVELVALNAAVVLVASGLVADLHSGYDLAVATIRCGRALEHMERLGGVESCLAV
jgi:anthranilate phosphoribosyltransferase